MKQTKEKRSHAYVTTMRIKCAAHLTFIQNYASFGVEEQVADEVICMVMKGKGVIASQIQRRKYLTSFTLHIEFISRSVKLFAEMSSSLSHARGPLAVRAKMIKRDVRARASLTR